MVKLRLFYRLLFYTALHFWLFVLLSSFVALLVNLSSILQIRHTSSLTHNVSGTGKATVQSILGWILQKDSLRVSTCFGTLVTSLGMCFVFILPL